MHGGLGVSLQVLPTKEPVSVSSMWSLSHTLVLSECLFPGASQARHAQTRADSEEREGRKRESPEPPLHAAIKVHNDDPRLEQKKLSHILSFEN